MVVYHGGPDQKSLVSMNITWPSGAVQLVTRPKIGGTYRATNLGIPKNVTNGKDHLVISGTFANNVQQVKVSLVLCPKSPGIFHALHGGNLKKVFLRGLSEQFRDNLYKMNLPMFCNILEDSMQCTHAKWFVTGNGEIMCFSVNDC